MKIVSVVILLFASNFIFADFWKELDKVLTVIEEIAAPTASNVVICEDVSQGRPVGISTSFPKNIRKLHVWFNIYGANPNITVSSVWMKEQNGQFSKIQELSKNAPSDQGQAWMDFSLAVSEGSQWPPGLYKVDIVWNNKIIGTVQFTITDAVKGGEGVWGGTVTTPPVIPPAVNLPSGKIETTTPTVDISILTEDEKVMMRNQSEEIIVQMVGSKIWAIESEYRSQCYNIRVREGGNPARIAEEKAKAQSKISQIKRWGNAALAVKNLPPRWNPDEPHPLDPEDNKSSHTAPQPKKQEEKVDFSF